MIERRWDQDAGIIYVLASGIWDTAEVDEHYKALRRLITQVRASGGSIRILSDVTAAGRQSEAIEDRVRDQMARTFRPGDRLALLTSNEEEQRYARSRIDDADMAVFSSRLPAEMWLLRDDAG